MSEVRGLAGLDLPNFRIAGEALSPEEEAARVQRSTWGGRHGIAGASAEGPEAFAENVMRPLAPWVLPQSPEDIALLLAFGPGARAARMAVGLGAGTLGFSREAEGSWLNVPQMKRMLRNAADRLPPPRPLASNELSSSSADNTRLVAHNIRLGDLARHGENRLDDFSEAVRLFSSEPTLTRPLRFPEQYSSQDINAAFADVAPTLWDRAGWIRTPHEWLGMAQPGRNETYPTVTGRFSTRWMPLVDPERPFIVDNVLSAAEPNVGRAVKGQMYNPSASAYRGFVTPPGQAGDPYYFGVRRGQDLASEQETFRHELQHILQGLRGAPPQSTGTNSTRVWAQNPQLQQNYLNNALSGLDPQAQETAARRLMYLAQPGEWEARTAGGALSAWRERLRTKASNLNAPIQTYYNPFADQGYPDFGVR